MTSEHDDALESAIQKLEQSILGEVRQVASPPIEYEPLTHRSAAGESSLGADENLHDIGIDFLHMEGSDDIKQKYGETMKKIAILQEDQEHHLQLIKNLQSKVINFKKENEDQEDLLMEKNKEIDGLKEMVSHFIEESKNYRDFSTRTEANFETLEKALDDERTANKNLLNSNKLLNQQISQLTETNQSLKGEVDRLNELLQHTATSLEKRDADLREEEAAFNEYFTAEHYRLLAVWKSVVQLRKQFTEMKKQTELDLEQLSSETVQRCQSIMLALKNYAHMSFSRNEVIQPDESVRIIELQTRNLSLNESLSRCQKQLNDLENHVHKVNKENEYLSEELANRDRLLSTIERIRSSSGLEIYAADPALNHGEYHLAATKKMIENAHFMQNALKQIAQTVLLDAKNVPYDRKDSSENFKSRCKNLKRSVSANAQDNLHVARMRSRVSGQPSRDSNSLSPQRSRCSDDENRTDDFDSPSTFKASRFNLEHNLDTQHSIQHLASSTINAVQACLNERALQLQSLKMKLMSAEEQIKLVKRRTEDLRQENIRFADSYRANEESTQSLRRELDMALRERDRNRNSLNLAQGECEELTKNRAVLQEQLDESKLERDRIRKKLNETQMFLDQATRDIEDVRKSRDSLGKENQQMEKQLDQSSSRFNQAWHELLMAQQHIKQMELDLQMQENLKKECSEERNRLEAKYNEIEKKFQRSREQEITLKSEITRLETISESQNREKIELDQKASSAQKIRSKITEELSQLKKDHLDLQDELGRVNEQILDQKNEISRLKISLQRVEQSRKELEVESSQTARDRLELAEALAQSDRERVNAFDESEDLRRELGRVTTAFEKATSENDSLFKQKNNMALQLSDYEKKCRDLQDRLRASSLERENLQASLMELRMESSGRAISEQNSLMNELQTLQNSNDQLNAQVAQMRMEFELEIVRLRSQKEGSTRDSDLIHSKESLKIAENRVFELETELARIRQDHATSNQELTASLDNLRRSNNLRNSEELHRVIAERDALQAKYNILLSEKNNLAERCENERDFAMALANEEKNNLNHQVNMLKDSITELEKYLENTRNQCIQQSETDRAIIENLRLERINAHQEFERNNSLKDTELTHLRREFKDLQDKYNSSQKESNRIWSDLDKLTREYDDLKVEMHLNSMNLTKIETILQDAKNELSSKTRTNEDLEKLNQDLELKNEESKRKIKKLEAELAQSYISVSNLKEELCRLRENHNDLSLRFEEEMASSHKSLEKIFKLQSSKVHSVSMTKNLEEENIILQQELNDLKQTINRFKEREAILRDNSREQKILKAEFEGQLTALKIELNQSHLRYSELQNELVSREKSSCRSVDQWHSEFLKLEEQKRNLENEHLAATQSVQNLKLNLETVEEKNRSLKQKLRKAEESRNDVELIMESIHNTLKRLLGFRQHLNGVYETSFTNSQNSQEIRSTHQHKNPFLKDPAIPRSNSCVTGFYEEEQHRSGRSRARNESVRQRSRSRDIEHDRNILDPECVKSMIQDLLKSYMDAERARDELKQELNAVQSRLQKNMNEFSILNEEYMRIQETCIELKKERSNFDQWAEKLNLNLESRTNELKKLEQINDQFRNDLIKRESDYRDLKVKLDHNNEEYEKRIKKIYDTKQNEKYEANNQVIQLKDALKRLELIKTNLESELHHKNSMFMEAEKENLMLSQKLRQKDEKTKDFEEKYYLTDTKLKQYETNFNSQTQEKEALLMKCEDLEAQINKMDSERNVLRSYCRNGEERILLMKEELRVAQEMLANVRKDLIDSKQQQQSLNESSRLLQTNLRESENERSRIISELKRFEVQIRDRECHIKELHDHINKLSGEKSQLNDQICTLEKNLEEIRLQISTHIKNYQRSMSENKVLQSRIDKLQHESKQLSTSLSSVSQDRNDLIEKIHKFNKESSELKRTISKLQNHIRSQDESHLQRVTEMTQRQKMEIEAEFERQKEQRELFEQNFKLKERNLLAKIKVLEHSNHSIS